KHQGACRVRLQIATLSDYAGPTVGDTQPRGGIGRPPVVSDEPSRGRATPGRPSRRLVYQADRRREPRGEQLRASSRAVRFTAGPTLRIRCRALLPDPADPWPGRA